MHVKYMGKYQIYTSDKHDGDDKKSQRLCFTSSSYREP